MKWDEKTIPSTVNHTHMEGLGGGELAKQFDEIFYIFRTVHCTIHM